MLSFDRDADYNSETDLRQAKRKAQGILDMYFRAFSQRMTQIWPEGFQQALLMLSTGKAVGQDAQAAIMRLALATRHRVERPAISMEGGTQNPMERLPAAVCFAFD